MLSVGLVAGLLAAYAAVGLAAYKLLFKTNPRRMMMDTLVDNLRRAGAWAPNGVIHDACHAAANAIEAAVSGDREPLDVLVAAERELRHRDHDALAAAFGGRS